jgi:type 1 glutamine amidotransferase
LHRWPKKRKRRQTKRTLAPAAPFFGDIGLAAADNREGDKDRGMVVVFYLGFSAMRKIWMGWLAAGLLLAGVPWFASAGDSAKPKKIVLLGMDRDHGAGEHEYMAGLTILAECLKQTPGVEITVLKVDGKKPGWPAEAKVLEDANTVVCFLRAGGGYFLADKERRAKLEELLKKGTGFVALHWAVEGPKNLGDPYMAILGGYYEPGFSKNPHNTATVNQADPSHPISRGWKPFEGRDEFYFKIRLLREAKAVVTATLKDRDGKEYKDETIGWVYEREDSKGPLGTGRSFGFTGCHFHVNFGIPEFRRLITNGILWTAGVEVPENGAPVNLSAPVPKVPDAPKAK